MRARRILHNAAFLMLCLVLDILPGSRVQAWEDCDSGISAPRSEQTLPSNGKIAFASNRDGNYEIYVMDADGSSVQRLTFEQGFDFEPDWSPDGEHIVFTSGRNNNIFDIYVMNADGSNQVNLTNTPNNHDRYPTWSPDGTKIAFSRRSGRGADIYIMNADGSGLTKVVDGQGEIYNLMPTWSPDSTQLIFSASPVLPIWDPLEAFILYKVNVDGSGQIEIGGAQPYGNPDWSWVRDEIVYYRVDIYDLLLFKMNNDGSNVMPITHEQEEVSRADEDPSWSPDGTRIVFSSISSGPTITADFDIFVIDADGTNLVNLTPTSDAEDITPDWQPVMESPTACDFTLPDSDSATSNLPVSNGKIAFASNQDGDYEIFIMDVDGSNIQQLTHNDTNDMWPSWSPDGTRIAFTSWRSGYGEIYVMNADGTNVINITNGETGYAPAWSPNGDKIAFTSGRGTAVDDIYITNIDGSDTINLTAASDSLDQLPSWSPEGDQIIFRTTREWEPLNGIEPFYDIYIMSADGTNQHKLMPAGYEPSAVSWSPDGVKLVFAIDRDVSRLYVAEADGTNPIVMPPNSDISGFDPHWSPVGDQIVFTAERPDFSGVEIAVMNADGSNFRYLTNFGGGNIHPAWQTVILTPPTACDTTIPD